MSWISRLFRGSEADQAREAAEAARERVQAEARSFERWCAAMHAEDRTTKAAAQAHLGSAEAASQGADLRGWLEAREQFELARSAYRGGRAALARAHPRESALLILAEAASATADVPDDEERSARAAGIAELQAREGDLSGARLTLESISEAVDRAGVERALVIARATAEELDPRQLARELAGSDPDAPEHEEILVTIAEERVIRGDLAGADAMLGPVDDPELKDRGRRCLALGEARRGRLAEACAIASALEDPRWRAAAWKDIALARAANGDLDAALEALEKLEEEDVRTRGLVELAGVFARAGRDARALVERIDDPQARDDALTWIAAAHAKKADFDAALATIEEI